ncbi:integrase, catalytic region, zinc finger, CCHC-type containing protein [Tanacetum coccineum]
METVWYTDEANQELNDINIELNKRKEKVAVQSESKGSDDEDIKLLQLILPPANKKLEYVKSEEKKEDKKVDEKKQDMSKVKCYNCKKEVHFAKDCKKAKVKDYNYYKTKMLLAKKDNSEESSSSAEETIAEVSYYTSDFKSKSEYETSEYYDNSTNYGFIYQDQIRKFIIIDSEDKDAFVDK